MSGRKPFTSFAFVLLLLVPQVLAAGVVQDSRTFVISLPTPVSYYGCDHNLTATVTSLGKQGFAVGWEVLWQNFDPSDYNSSPASGVRLTRTGNRVSWAEVLEPTPYVDPEDGYATGLSFANLGGGRFVSVAEVVEYDENGPYSICYRRFAAGQPAPDSDSVLLEGGWPADAHVASNGNGLFVIAWNRELPGESGQNGTVQEIAQVLGADGERVSPEIAVTEPMEERNCCGNSTLGSTVGMAADGTFVVLWRDFRAVLHPLMGRRFDRMGRPLGEPFWLTNGAGRPAMAMAPSGQFVVAWRGGFSSSSPILVSRFTADGKRLGPLARLDGDGEPAIALDRSGRVALSWLDTRGIAFAALDASLKQLRPVIYDAASLPRDPYFGGPPWNTPKVAFGEDGRALTVWVGHWGNWARDAVLGRFWWPR